LTAGALWTALRMSHNLRSSPVPIHLRSVRVRQLQLRSSVPDLLFGDCKPSPASSRRSRPLRAPGVDPAQRSRLILFFVLEPRRPAPFRGGEEWSGGFSSRSPSTKRFTASLCGIISSTLLKDRAGAFSNALGIYAAEVKENGFVIVLGAFICSSCRNDHSDMCCKH